MQTFNMVFKCVQCKHQNVGDLAVPPSWNGTDEVIAECSLCGTKHEVTLAIYPVEE